MLGFFIRIRAVIRNDEILPGLSNLLQIKRKLRKHVILFFLNSIYSSTVTFYSRIRAVIRNDEILPGLSNLLQIKRKLRKHVILFFLNSIYSCTVTFYSPTPSITFQQQLQLTYKK